MTPSPLFRVENLGPIRTGEVELRPLTLLIGKNNTGKTYMAQAIHAAHKALNMTRSADPSPPLDGTEIMILEDLLRNRTFPRDVELPPAVATKALTWIHGFLQDASENLPGRVRAYFGVSGLQEITSWGSDNPCSISVRGKNGGTSANLFGTPSGSPQVSQKHVNFSKHAANQLDHMIQYTKRYPRRFGHDAERRDGMYFDFEYNLYTLSLSEGLWAEYLSSYGFGATSYYLPSGRSGLLQAWTDVVRMKLQLDRERFGLERDRDISLGGVALDFLSEFQSLFSQHSRLQRRQPSQSDALDSVRQLLQKTIDGSVTIDSEVDEIPALIYQQGDKYIPIQRASSMVADLAPLAIWSQELVDPGDLLIVDEPESHLHPEAIRQVARALVRLANAGVKVLCATHSPVLLHQISNCMLSAADPGGNGGLTTEDAIAHSDIGVFLFKHDDAANGVTVNEVPVDPEWGIPEDEYVDIADDLTNQTAALIDARAV